MFNVQALRSRLNWPQSRIADYLGMSQAGVCYIERSGRMKKPVRMALERLAQEHGLSIDEFVSGGADAAVSAPPAGPHAPAPAPGGAASSDEVAA